MTSDSRWLVIGAFALIYLVWGSTYLSVALALGSIPPFLLMATRSVIGGTALVVGAKLSGSPAASIADWARAAVCGFLFFVACHGILAYAQQYVPSGIAALLLATIPFWIALIDALLPGGNRPSARQILLLIPGFTGVGLIVMSQMGSVFRTSETSSYFWEGRRPGRSEQSCPGGGRLRQSLLNIRAWS